MWASTLNQAHPRVWFILFIAITTSACSVKQKATPASCASRVSSVYSGPSERTYCTAVATPSGGKQIYGYAKYDARTVGTSTSGLTDTSTGNPIRYAEVEILTAAGARVQCGETDATGYFNLSVPTGTAPLTVRINSRSAKLDTFSTPQVNPVINASVLTCPEENQLYALTATATPIANVDLGTITAAITGTVLGGAFNIYDQIVNANQFLAQTSTAGSCGALGCTNFTVAPKVAAYWVKGFNPNSYFGETQSGISFYMPGYSRLFIMGGVDGDVDSSDTDHFDNSIILHEYGHFLEDAYSITDSPGGQHSGTSQIDPRLAWSEGWGNFIQAAVRNTACYTDTEGNSTGTTDFIFNVPLEDATPSSGNGGCENSDIRTSFDVPSFTGEGTFREFTVSRYLWDVFDAANESGLDDINNAFKEIWAAMTSTNDFKDTSEEFRSVGLLNEAQQNYGTSSWSTLRTTHKMTSGREEYALPVTPTIGGCTDFSLTPAGSSVTDLLRRNDFFFYHHPGGAVTIKLTYTTASGTEADVDLRVYNSHARLFRSDRADEVMRSELEPDGSTATPEVESATKTLAAGDYLIQALVFTTGSAFTYNVTVTTASYPSGAELCH